MRATERIVGAPDEADRALACKGAESVDLVPDRGRKPRHGQRAPVIESGVSIVAAWMKKPTAARGLAK